MDKLQQLENKCHLLKADSSPESMLELVNIVREFIIEVRYLYETKKTKLQKVKDIVCKDCALLNHCAKDVKCNSIEGIYEIFKTQNAKGGRE